MKILKGIWLLSVKSCDRCIDCCEELLRSWLRVRNWMKVVLVLLCFVECCVVRNLERYIECCKCYCVLWRIVRNLERYIECCKVLCDYFLVLWEVYWLLWGVDKGMLSVICMFWVLGRVIRLWRVVIGILRVVKSWDMISECCWVFVKSCEVFGRFIECLNRFIKCCESFFEWCE
jgi:hypothetical protein